MEPLLYVCIDNLLYVNVKFRNKYRFHDNCILNKHGNLFSILCAVIAVVKAAFTI